MFFAIFVESEREERKNEITTWKVCSFIYSWISYFISLSELHKILHFQLSNGRVNSIVWGRNNDLFPPKFSGTLCLKTSRNTNGWLDGVTFWVYLVPNKSYCKCYPLYRDVTAISMATRGNARLNATKKDFLLLVLPARRKVGVRIHVLVANGLLSKRTLNNLKITKSFNSSSESIAKYGLTTSISHIK